MQKCCAKAVKQLQVGRDYWEWMDDNTKKQAAKEGGTYSGYAG